MEFHLYEIVLESPVMWVNIQASCESHWQANAMLEARFGGTTNASPWSRILASVISPCQSGSLNVLSG